MDDKNSTEDLKILRNYAIGVAGFATTISAILIQALHFPAEATILCVAGFACVMLVIVYLINKSEQRQKMKLKEHIESSEKAFGEFRQDLADIKKMLLENSKSTLRIEMNDEIARHPENHDTILKMAEKYFLPIHKGGLAGNWVEREIFYGWIEDEKQQKRPVHLSPELLEQLSRDNKL